ncbi:MULTISPECIES: hypothetical protein [unclassified Pasteurella]|uniref:hypothetical protein n=1 Tax=unclassified Pasteurella TaxID=2621516 RepID=UPI0010734C2A|nr:hypothetical protein [Pasteurella sp. 19428wF3_WM03]TFU52002.1 hypothetical protein E4T92_04335 [Pasteurella sp. WM03]
MLDTLHQAIDEYIDNHRNDLAEMQNLKKQSSAHISDGIIALRVFAKSLEDFGLSLDATQELLPGVELYGFAFGLTTQIKMLEIAQYTETTVSAICELQRGQQ